MSAVKRRILDRGPHRAKVHLQTGRRHVGAELHGNAWSPQRPEKRDYRFLVQLRQRLELNSRAIRVDPMSQDCGLQGLRAAVMKVGRRIGDTPQGRRLPFGGLRVIRGHLERRILGTVRARVGMVLQFVEQQL